MIYPLSNMGPHLMKVLKSSKCTKRQNHRGRTRISKMLPCVISPTWIKPTNNITQNPVQRGENESIDSQLPCVISPTSGTKQQTQTIKTNRGENESINISSPLCNLPDIWNKTSKTIKPKDSKTTNEGRTTTHTLALPCVFKNHHYCNKALL